MSAEAPPPFLGVRFDAEGRALRCSGCTVIGHIRPGPVFDALAAARDALAAAPGGACFAWLPPSSWHMTLFDGLLHSRRAPGFWPDALPRHAAEAAADAWFIDAVRAAPTPPPAPFALRPTGIAASGGGIGVTLEGATSAEEARLRAFRDALAAATGLADRPGHATYRFHVTLAYALAHPADPAAFDAALAAAAAALIRAAPRFTIGPPEICVFEDMTEFRPLARLV